MGALQSVGSPEPDGGWSWITGEPWDYTNWNAREPNNANGGEDKMQLNNFGKWNDVAEGGLDRAGYIVEFEPPTAKSDKKPASNVPTSSSNSRKEDR